MHVQGQRNLPGLRARLVLFVLAAFAVRRRTLLAGADGDVARDFDAVDVRRAPATRAAAAEPFIPAFLVLSFR